MSKLQPVRGTHDLLPDDMRQHRFIISQAFAVAQRYGYGEIATPVFEFSEVFHRTLGDTSDVVTKETYSFTDRGGENLTLRPEFTASIARAFISNSLQDQLPLKFFYAGPAFRYERPQKGRQRQFHQIGTELLGVAEPQGDIETIALAYRVLESLGLKDKVTLEINSLGDQETRKQYSIEVKKYFEERRSELSSTSSTRLDINPLRIFDSKDANDQIISAAVSAKVWPKPSDLSIEYSTPSFFTAAAVDHHNAVLKGLKALGIPFKHNPQLVRGLDYYSHTIFEFTTDLLGAQGTVLAGGRYDGLIEMMGGAPTAGIGWAAGIERLAALVDFTDKINTIRPIAIIPMGAAAEREALILSEKLRSEGFTIELGYKGNLGNRMKKANKANACAALIIGDAELAKGVVLVKNLDHSLQQEVAFADLTSVLAPYLKKH